MTAGDRSPIELSKLLKPDPEHHKAVAQSWLGRVLGFGRSYGMAAAAFLAVAIILDQGVAYILEPSWPARSWRLALICGGLAVPAFWLYYAQRPRARPSLFVQTELAKPGYFRIGPYEDIDKDRRAFHRADGEHERVLNWLLRQEGTPLYLTGDSGTGKSSLLQAFVLPALCEADWTAKVIRTLDDPEAALRQALGATSGNSTDTRALLARAARKAKGNLLVVLDQFEEFVILQDGTLTTTVERFRALLDQLAREPVPGLRLLLVLRSDYQTLIERLGLPPLRQGENWRQVGRFGMADAKAFVAASGLCLTEQETNRLLAGAADLDDTPGLIRPVTLNIIGFILATGRAVWREHTAADALIRSYIRTSIRHPAIRAYAPRLLPGLVTAVGTKRSRTLGELAATAGLDPAQARNVLLTLQAAGLVRPLGEAQEMWEVSHDFVARLLERELVSRRRVWWPAPRDGDPAETQRIAEAQARAALADLGIFIRETAQGLELTIASDVSDVELRRAKPFLALFAPRLTRANLGGSATSDLVPLPGSHRSPVQIADLEPLSGFAALQSLNLSFTKVNDLSPLSGLVRLESLELAFTSVADLKPLAGLTALRSLDLRATKITDLMSLAGLKKLQLLNISSTRIATLAPLAESAALKSLDFSGTKVIDVAPLARLTKMKSVTFSSTKVTDLTPISGLLGLELLNLSHSAVVDLAPLSRLLTLQSLNLSDTKIVDLAPLSGLLGLQWLDLSDTNIVDLAPLTSLKALQRFSFHRARATEFASLAALSSLRSLDLFQASIADLTPLSGLAELQILNLFGTRVADLSPLSGLRAVQSLDLSQTQVSDLSPLSGLVGLQRLDLSFTKVFDLTPLSGLTALQSLDLRYTKVADLAPLQDLPLSGRLDPPEVGSEELERFRQIRIARGLAVPFP